MLSRTYFTSLYGLLGIYEIPPLVGYLLAVIFIVGIINAINLIDGIDGLASGLSMIALTFFGIFATLYGHTRRSCSVFLL
mgnify:CR=1 FL=1